ncbi:3-hydroxylacyl-ACP dehydratase [Acinetobacter qingfengensis]|uniref:3-hydroxylacyl-ACP dehydratase n=1 Tax=Acinetobacter qingfengensis TaxID=1262585 RepID=A0A1E7R2V4_9GAMM|nr:3-hydroxylacyl-ACP dehydratase [Acinetobacter qingfengensis]KAA8733862.1 3-hydroxylacyl-ACP dehydratase [Acinetobacter qingfengensis]OEY93625.1 3-hydroxylacyl-ACP dehydratase [Acinetobacter qingfengensis]
MSESALPYIPHQAPMIFIDELLECGIDHAVAKLTIHPELMFLEPQGLPTWTSIELMAQTISLYAGVQGKAQGQPPKIGFLLGTRKLHLPFPYFPLHSEVQITVHKNYMHDNLGMFQCEIIAQEQTITAVLSVYEPDSTESERQGL